jgi:hypothetical protein
MYSTRRSIFTVGLAPPGGTVMLNMFALCVPRRGELFRAAGGAPGSWAREGPRRRSANSSERTPSGVLVTFQRGMFPCGAHGVLQYGCLRRPTRTTSGTRRYVERDPCGKTPNREAFRQARQRHSGGRPLRSASADRSTVSTSRLEHRKARSSPISRPQSWNCTMTSTTLPTSRERAPLVELSTPSSRRPQDAAVVDRPGRGAVWLLDGARAGTQLAPPDPEANPSGGHDVNYRMGHFRPDRGIHCEQDRQQDR